jgi:hypothetical protein
MKKLRKTPLPSLLFFCRPCFCCPLTNVVRRASSVPALLSLPAFSSSRFPSPPLFLSFISPHLVPQFSLMVQQSYESLQAPHSASASTFSTPPGSADGRQGAFETLQGDRSRRDQQYSYEQPQQRQRQAVWQPPPKHEAIPMGGGCVSELFVWRAR